MHYYKKTTGFVLATLAIVFLVGVYHQSKSQNRNPSSLNYEVVSDNVDYREIFLKDQDPKNKLILISFKRYVESGPLFKVHPSRLGIEQKSQDELIDPMFILSVSEEGVEKVYAFELAYYHYPKIEMVPPKLRGTRQEEVIMHPERFAGLPPVLINTKHRVKGTLFNYFYRLVLSSLSLVNLGPIGALGLFHDFELKGIRETQAKILYRILNYEIQLASRSQLPRLISMESIKKLNNSLLLKYESKLKVQGLLFKEEKLEKCVEEYSCKVSSQIEKSKEKLQTQAQEEGLDVFWFGEVFGCVFIDFEKFKILDTETKKRILSNEEVQKLYSNYLDDDHTSYRLRYKPVAVYTLDREMGDFHFANPDYNLIDKNQPVVRQKFWNTFKFLRSLTYSLIPVTNIATALYLTDRGLGIQAKTSMREIFNYHVRTVGELRAALELGMIAEEDRNLFYASLLEFLDIKSKNFKLKDFQNKLVSSNSEEADQLFQEILTAYAVEAETTQYVLNGRDLKKLNFGKEISTMRFGNWLNVKTCEKCRPCDDCKIKEYKRLTH